MLAYDCLPDAGSDPGIGWQAVCNAAQQHHVIAFTKASNRSAIEAAPSIDNVEWHWIDVPEKLGPIETGTSLGDAIHNLIWLRVARRKANPLIESGRVDLTHYVTFSAFWMPVPFADAGVPHVFGPVSGGEIEPVALTAGSSKRAKFKERLRSMMQDRGMSSRAWKRMASSPTTLMVAATEQTAKRMREAGAESVEVFRTAFSLTPELLSDLDELPRQDRPGGPHLVITGRQLHWKGHDLAIAAMPHVIARHPDVQLTVIGKGPRHDDLREQVATLELGDSVTFAPTLSRTEERTELVNADVFVFPSRRDSGSTLLPMAQASRVPIAAFDTGAVRDVTAGMSALADPTTAATPAKALAEAILDVLDGKLEPILDEAVVHARTRYGVESARTAMESWYAHVTA